MTTAPPTNPGFDKLLKTADELLKGKDLNASLVISLATSLAVEVNALSSLSGAEKKALVIQTVKAKLDEALEASKTAPAGQTGSLSVEELKTLIFLTENALPTVLDTVVAVARGKIDLKKVVPKSWTSCFSCFAASAVQVAVAETKSVPVSVLSSKPPVQEQTKEEVIALQSNPLHEKSEAKVVVVKEAEPEPAAAPAPEPHTETPPPQNTDTASEAPSVVEVSPATPAEKSSSAE